MAYDAYLKLDGITGESTRKGYEKQMELQSFSLGVSNSTTVGTGTTGASGGKASLGAFSIVRVTDSASPSLFQGCALGTSYASATVSLNKASGDDTPLTYLTYEFKLVYITDIHWSGHTGGDDAPTESVTFVYGSLKVTYTPQDSAGGASGSMSGSYDQTKATK